MALIEWQDSFALGIPEVDHEHKMLIDLINRLHGSLLQAASKVEICDFLAELHAWIASHFALEESVMRRCGYDQLAQHKAEHERLLDEICEIMDNHMFDAYANYERVLAEHLREWFEAHFRNADRRLHDALPRSSREG